MAISKHLYLNHCLLSGSTLMKDICAEGYCIKTDFLHEVRW